MTKIYRDNAVEYRIAHLVLYIFLVEPTGKEEDVFDFEGGGLLPGSK